MINNFNPYPNIKHPNNVQITESISNHSSDKFHDKFKQQTSQIIQKLEDFTPKIDYQQNNRIIQQNQPNTNHQNQKKYIQQLEYKISQMQNQMQQLHQKYNYELEQESRKVNQKTQFFLNLIQQIHNNHNEELMYYKNLITQFEQQKKQITNIENKMNHIGSGIEDILRQSSQLSKTNEQLQGRLVQKDKQIQFLHQQIDKLKQKIEGYQLMLDDYQKLKLKVNKYNRDILEMIQDTEKQVQYYQKPSLKNNNNICSVTQNNKNNCQHCKLSNLSDKYSKMLDSQQPDQ